MDLLAEFPFWLRTSHWINAFFLGLLARAGIQILAALPKLYWKEGAVPGTEWLKFTRKQLPTDRVWISLEEEIEVPTLIAQPGGNNLGLGRHWHFFSALFWILNGAVYVVFLFATDEWRRLLPTSWSVFPDALRTAWDYLTFHAPPADSFNPYDPLQQLSYAGVVFLLAPFLILTGLAQSPAITARYPGYSKIFGGRQKARSLHFLGLVAMVLFTVGHTVMVFVNGPKVNFGNIMLGQHESSGWLALILGLCLIAAIFLVYGLTSWLSLRQPRLVQRALGYVLTRARQLWPERLESRQEYSRRDISPLFRVNGYPPDTDEYSALAAEDFRDWRLRVGGLVERPQELTLGDIRYLTQQSQITRHNCIQGWSAVGEWTGLPLITLLDLCSPLPAARYLIFWSLQRDESGRPFYESLAMRFARQPQTMLAYELNGEALDVPHGAPLRLRVETQLGFKMVKWLDRIEFVDDFRRFRDGMGGSREDLMYYDWTAGI
ncbi:MAG TPA: molybdopterin-dependent oxidoreductase [Dehalococcoidia bacterium]|nr:molybdopterin-dependent oxidoreductase [Dehalococcoidia bacterium]